VRFSTAPDPAPAEVFFFMRKLLYTIVSILLVLIAVFVFGPSRPSSDTGAPASARADLAPTTVAVDLLVGEGGALYLLALPQGSSVYDAMIQAASTTPFSFVSEFYPGLGHFVKEINGTKNSNGAYWTLYVNGIFSPVGASGYRLNEGDSIEWKFEKK
jgi:hypothetical protein